ncbi:MAG: hypothetical protein A3I68_05980 [Candidatus Melainabacteria bacterium RIFCSPLOWO2_02_FULL_35_15]|nr:MAG: hypothetical protein A3F80_02190 [Candidatus Melainabacteria bacterium RIFCSPLOWO2_12_FULL_35_11]OGI13751.1 MAG: hypothetical protein A3I68_05980 [Candidatus Melainabacteria bacterium RIFCSPLOWO2_02_FULL_35_15]
MKNKLQVIIIILVLIFGLNVQVSYAKHKNNSSNVTLGVLGAVLGTYAAVDSTDNSILDDSNPRADRFIYSQISAGSSEVEINNLFLSSLNPLEEHYEVNYIDSSGMKKCFRVEESGIIRSIYKKLPCP